MSNVAFDGRITWSSVHESEDGIGRVVPGIFSGVAERREPLPLDLPDGVLDDAVEEFGIVGPQVDIARARTGPFDSVLHSGSDEGEQMKWNCDKCTNSASWLCMFSAYMPYENRWWE